MTNQMFRLPDALGGATVGGIRDGNFVKVDLGGDLGSLVMAANLLTEVAPPAPPLPAEPPVGTVVSDYDGDVWHHKEQGKWFFGSTLWTWAELCARYTALTPIGNAADPARAAIDGLDMASPLPAEFDTVMRSRRIAVNPGRYPGQLIVQVHGDEGPGRAGILDAATAELMGRTLIKAAHDLRAGAL